MKTKIVKRKTFEKWRYIEQVLNENQLSLKDPQLFVQKHFGEINK